MGQELLDIQNCSLYWLQKTKNGQDWPEALAEWQFGVALQCGISGQAAVLCRTNISLYQTARPYAYCLELIRGHEWVRIQIRSVALPILGLKECSGSLSLFFLSFPLLFCFFLSVPLLFCFFHSLSIISITLYLFNTLLPFYIKQCFTVL